MNPFDIGDSVAVDALQSVLHAVWTDHHEAIGNGGEVVPDALMAVHRVAGLFLADRCFLAVERDDDDLMTDIVEFERVACTRLLTRLDLAQRQTDLISPEWITAGAAELCKAFRSRLDDLYRRPQGGVA